MQKKRCWFILFNKRNCQMMGICDCLNSWGFFSHTKTQNCIFSSKSIITTIKFLYVINWIKHHHEEWNEMFYIASLYFKLVIRFNFRLNFQRQMKLVNVLLCFFIMNFSYLFCHFYYSFGKNWTNIHLFDKLSTQNTLNNGCQLLLCLF